MCFNHSFFYVWGHYGKNSFNADFSNFFSYSKSFIVSPSFYGKNNAFKNLSSCFFTFYNLLINFKCVSWNKINLRNHECIIPQTLALLNNYFAQVEINSKKIGWGFKGRLLYSGWP